MEGKYRTLIGPSTCIGFFRCTALDFSAILNFNILIVEMDFLGFYYALCFP